MASISKEPNGRRTIQFVGTDGKRRSIRLGKVSQRQAEQIKLKVENLNAAAITGHAPDDETSRWVAQLDDVLADKLARVGLIAKPEQKTAAKLGAFIEGYISRRSDVSPHTRRIWRQTARRLEDHFGAEKLIHEVTCGDATDWRLSLIAEGLADASVRKHCGFAKHFFAQAVDHELITSNPFGKLVSSPVGNETRQYFVTREEIQRVLDACPDAEWRLIVALSRYGGLRCPSEHLALSWGDVDWENERLHVSSPKTARHAGHESRIVPLFPELRPYLEAVFDAAEPGTEHVITRYRDPNGNQRTQMARIVRRAGLKPWPRIFHNLRSSRQTELEESFPSHVVCAWIGNSPQVARKHYLQVTEDHFQKAVQNPVQQAHASGGNASQAESDAHEKAPCFQGAARECEKVRTPPTEVHGNRTHRRRDFRAAQRF